MQTIYLDFTEITSLQKLHAYLKNAFNFPDWYGNNFDALYDLLTEISEDTKIDINACSDNPLFQQLKNVLQDAAAENSHLLLQSAGISCSSILPERNPSKSRVI